MSTDTESIRKISFSMPSALYRHIVLTAKSERRSVSAYLRNLIENDLVSSRKAITPFHSGDYSEEGISAFIQEVLNRFNRLRVKGGLTQDEAIWQFLLTPHIVKFLEAWEIAKGESTLGSLKAILTGEVLFTSTIMQEAMEINEGKCPLIEGLSEWSGTDQRDLYDLITKAVANK